MRKRTERVWLCLLAAVFLISGVQIPALAESEVQGITLVDYSFDEGSDETGIYSYQYVSSSGLARVSDPDTDASGSATSGSVKFTIGEGTNVWGQQVTVRNNNADLVFEANTEYTVSLDVKSTAADGYLMIIAGGGSVAMWGTKMTVTNEDGWKHYEQTITRDANERWYFVVNGSNGVNYWFDNIKVSKKPAEPKLVSSDPAEGGTIIPRSTITLTFGNDMDESTVTDIDNYILNGEKAVKSVSSTDQKTYVLKLENVMTPDTAYTLTGSGLKDIYGQVMDTFSVNFETERGAEPHIESSIPADGSYNVATDDMLQVTFDAEISPETATTEHISIDGGAEIESIMVNEDDLRKITVAFKNLSHLTRYTVTFSGIKGVAGGIMSDKTITFTTQGQVTVAYNNTFSAETDTKWPVVSLEESYKDKMTLELYEDDCISAPSALKVVFDAANRTIYLGDPNQGYELEAGKYYTISFWAKTLPGESGAKINIVQSDESAYIGNITPTSEWQKVTRSFKAPIARMPMLRSTSAGTVLIDDIKIAESFTPEIMEDASEIPAQCARNVSVSEGFSVVLNNSISECEVTLNGQAVDNVTIVNNKATFAPVSPLEYDTVYKMNIKLTDEYGVNCELKREFRTEATFATNSGIKLYSDFGETGETDITNAALRGGRISAVIRDLKNNSGVSAKAYLIIALYKDGAMVDAGFAKTTLAAGGSIAQPMFTSLEMPETMTDGSYTLSAFLWNGIDRITPITKKIEIKK